jgi:hypothetical protein
MRSWLAGRVLDGEFGRPHGSAGEVSVMRRTYVAGFLAIASAASLSDVTETWAATITVGTAIPLSATTFALPVVIEDAVEATAWQFDLAYDPSDIQLNTLCDSFTDPYCGLITGPVTEGDFFASGAPFNLLLPGFLELDPVTLEQTGLLFGVSGAYGGSPPAPSGEGVLAYVQFAIVGTGDSSITVRNPSTVEAPIPEPGASLLFCAGLLLVARRSFASRRRLAF